MGIIIALQEGGPHDQAREALPGVGRPEGAVRVEARKAEYRMTSIGKDGLALVHAPGSFGRFLCEIRFEGSKVTSARYVQND